jgi:hypothetical protein
MRVAPPSPEIAMPRQMIVLLFALGGLLAGCANTAPPEDFARSVAPSAQGIRQTVGVISMIGDTFALQKVGMTIFGNDLVQVPIPSWVIDDTVTARIAAHLTPRFDVRRVTPADPIFGTPGSLGGIFGNPDGDVALGNALRQAAASQKYDLYVVVTKSAGTFSNTKVAISGLGIAQTSLLSLTRTHLYALADIRVYDGNTFRVVKSGTLSAGDATFAATIRGPNRQIELASWPAAADGDAKLRQTATALIQESLSVTLPRVLPVPPAQQLSAAR